MAINKENFACRRGKRCRPPAPGGGPGRAAQFPSAGSGFGGSRGGFPARRRCARLGPVLMMAMVCVYTCGQTAYAYAYAYAYVCVYVCVCVSNQKGRRTMNQFASGTRRLASRRLHLIRPTLSVGSVRKIDANGHMYIYMRGLVPASHHRLTVLGRQLQKEIGGQDSNRGVV